MTRLSIGRLPNNKIIINHDKVSRHHAILTIKKDGTMTIMDDKSSHGTKVNGKKITANVEVVINRGDKVLFADKVSLDWHQVPDIKYPENIKKIIKIGKGQGSDYYLNNSDGISRDHAEIIITENKKIYLFDKSQKGTSVNGISINRYEFVPIKKKDKVSFAGKDILDWKKLKAPSSFNHWYITIPASVIAVALAVFFVINSLIDDNPKPKLYDQYKNSIALVYNAYVYKVVINDKTIYFDSNMDYTFDINKVKEPIKITGSAFFVSEDGKLMTNRHVAMPWESDTRNKQNLTNYLNSEFSKNPPSDVEDFVKMLQTLSTLKITGESVFIGIGLVDNHISTNQNDFIPCRLYGSPSDEEIDLAIIQMKDKRLPEQVKNIFDCNDIVETADLTPGTQVHIMGFPFGLKLATTKEGLKINFQSGQISKGADKYLFGFNAGSYHGSSGSPVFNNDGKLIGVCNSGIDEASGFSFGVNAIHAKNLLESTKLK